MRRRSIVPETKPLRDLLKDFRRKKVHIAIVSTSTGGTAGLITIEDIFEETRRRHQRRTRTAEPEMLVRLDDQTAEADARIYHRRAEQSARPLPPHRRRLRHPRRLRLQHARQDPEAGTTFEHDNVKYTILDAVAPEGEPRKAGDGDATRSDKWRCGGGIGLVPRLPV
jgi:CBS domain containing-hemolysin-like protein